ncbi:MAG: hypothetical protein JRJ25_00260 [Deltaproteobacteria bacterium]|nr:hypothetical protein [Deltaproteobacteria bacterium]
MRTIQPLKKSFVIVALIFLFIGFGIEYGGPNLPFFQKLLPTTLEMIRDANNGIDETMDEEGKPKDHPDRLDAKKEARQKITESEPAPPGYSLEADGLYLWVVFFSILISLIGMLITKASVHRVGMIISLINSIIVIFISIFLIVLRGYLWSFPKRSRINLRRSWAIVQNSRCCSSLDWRKSDDQDKERNSSSDHWICDLFYH